MPNPNPQWRRDAAEEKVRDRIARMLRTAPVLTEEQCRELRPLLRSENVTTSRGKRRGKADGSSAGAMGSSTRTPHSRRKLT